MVGGADVCPAGCIAEWSPCQPPLTVRKTSSAWQPSWLPSWGLPRCLVCSWFTSSLSQRSSCRQSKCPIPAHRLWEPHGGQPQQLEASGSPSTYLSCVCMTVSQDKGLHLYLLGSHVTANSLIGPQMGQQACQTHHKMRHNTISSKEPAKSHIDSRLQS